MGPHALDPAIISIQLNSKGLEAQGVSIHLPTWALVQLNR